MDHQHPRKTIAAFDFDGTLTTKDSLLHFLLFKSSPLKLLLRAVPSLYYVLMYSLKLMPNFVAKQALFSLFFRGMAITDFDRRCHLFLTRLNGMVRPEAKEKIQWHQSMGHEVVIISASIENWIIPFAQQMGVDTVLATTIEVNSGVVTGKFLSKNCFGPEKAVRLLERFPDRENYILYAYGDSNGDRELLGMADHPFYRSF